MAPAQPVPKSLFPTAPADINERIKQRQPSAEFLETRHVRDCEACILDLLRGCAGPCTRGRNYKEHLFEAVAAASMVWAVCFRDMIYSELSRDGLSLTLYCSRRYATHNLQVSLHNI